MPISKICADFPDTVIENNNVLIFKLILLQYVLRANRFCFGN